MTTNAPASTEAPLVLAIDTSTLTASVAVVRGGDVLSRGESSVNSHSEQLLQLVDTALSEAGTQLADVTAIAVGAGPGSFTGLRIGMATAKGLAFAAGKPLWLVSSLRALAHAGAETAAAAGDLGAGATVAAVMDARRGEIFLGLYEVAPGIGSPRPLHDERVLKPTDLARALSELGLEDPLLCGDGLEKFTELRSLGTVIDGARPTPSAASVGKLAALGDHVDGLASGAPVYIRKSEAEIRFPDGNTGGAFRKIGDPPST